MKGLWRGRVRDRILDITLATNLGYRLYLRHKSGRWRPSGSPNARWMNTVLETRESWEKSFEQVKMLGLPPHPDAAKNWDSLAALDCVLSEYESNAWILDAGAEFYSVILPWLYLYGYANLYGIGFAFQNPARRGRIMYDYGDITRTQFRPNTFDVITSLSVIEHGVDPRAYFAEASRVLKDNGILITSTDYWCKPVDTKGQWALGVPIRVFSEEDIREALGIASDFGLKPRGSLDLDCGEKAVRWEEYGLEYSFLVFALYKS